MYPPTGLSIIEGLSWCVDMLRADAFPQPVNRMSVYFKHIINKLHIKSKGIPKHLDFVLATSFFCVTFKTLSSYGRESSHSEILIRIYFL